MTTMNATQQLTRAELLTGLRDGWGAFLPAIARLTEGQQAAFARLQGFPHVQDLLAHICAWWERTLEVVPAIAGGGTPARDCPDVDAFNERAVARYESCTRAQLESEFERLRGAVAGLIAGLPSGAIENTVVYPWLLDSAVEHYEAHRPPAVWWRV